MRQDASDRSVYLTAGFVKRAGSGRGACAVCGREFGSLSEADAHVRALMDIGAFADHVMIHAGDSGLLGRRR